MKNRLVVWPALVKTSSPDVEWVCQISEIYHVQFFYLGGGVQEKDWEPLPSSDTQLKPCSLN